MLPNDVLDLIFQLLEDKSLLTVIALVCKLYSRLSEAILLQRMRTYLGYSPLSWKSLLPRYRYCGVPCIFDSESREYTMYSSVRDAEKIFDMNELYIVDIHGEAVVYSHLEKKRTLLGITSDIVRDEFRHSVYRLVNRTTVVSSGGTVIGTLDDCKKLITFAHWYRDRKVQHALLYLSNSNQLMMSRDGQTSYLHEKVESYYVNSNILFILTNGAKLRVPLYHEPFVTKTWEDARYQHAQKLLIDTWLDIVLTPMTDQPITFTNDALFLSSKFIKDIAYISGNEKVALLYHSGALTMCNIYGEDEYLIDTRVISITANNYVGSRISYIRSPI